jgi:hypothetical protein
VVKGGGGGCEKPPPEIENYWFLLSQIFSSEPSLRWNTCPPLLVFIEIDTRGFSFPYICKYLKTPSRNPLPLLLF